MIHTGAWTEKKFLFFFQKRLDKIQKLCYNKDTKRGGEMSGRLTLKKSPVRKMRPAEKNCATLLKKIKKVLDKSSKACYN